MRGPRKMFSAVGRRFFVLGMVGVAAVSVAAVLALSSSTTTNASRAIAPATTPVSASSGSATGVANVVLAGGQRATSGRVIVVLKDQHTNLNLIKQGKLAQGAGLPRPGADRRLDQGARRKRRQQLVAVNAVAAKLSAAEVSQLDAHGLGGQDRARQAAREPGVVGASPAANVPNAQVSRTPTGVLPAPRRPRRRA